MKFQYKGFTVVKNKDGEFNIYTKDEMEQPAAFRQIEMTSGTEKDAREFIDSY